MRKIFLGTLVIYFLYAVLISSYLFIVDPPLENHYVGTEADPATFMDEERLQLAKEYSKWRNVIYFINTPFEWLIYIFILCFGISLLFQNWTKTVSKHLFIQTALYVMLLSSFSWLVSYPISFFSYRLSKEYQISVQTFDSWMRDQFISFWVGAIILTIIAYAIFMIMKRSTKKWWLYTWILSIPFTLFMMFIQPVIIDPLYNDFYPIQDKELEAEILQLAAEAEIPADRVYEVQMSDKTNAMNAYVTGIGNNLRIVMWDTTLERLSTDEVLYIMAHEMGHYDLNHLPLLLVGSIFASLLGLFFAHRGYDFLLRNYGNLLKMKHGELATLPIILLIISLLSFAASPMTNTISRSYEYQSDRYAIDLTNNPDAAISTFHKLSTEGLSDVNPPAIVKIFRYTHPPMVERITHIRDYSENKE